MAIAKAFEDTYNSIDIVGFDVEEYAIGGKLISATVEMVESDYVTHKNDIVWKEHMRKLLTEKLVEELLRKYVEITTHVDPITLTQKINARCYLAPNDQVKILRSLKQK